MSPICGLSNKPFLVENGDTINSCMLSCGMFIRPSELFVYCHPLINQDISSARSIYSSTFSPRNESVHHVSRRMSHTNRFCPWKLSVSPIKSSVCRSQRYAGCADSPYVWCIRRPVFRDVTSTFITHAYDLAKCSQLSYEATALTQMCSGYERQQISLSATVAREMGHNQNTYGDIREMELTHKKQLLTISFLRDRLDQLRNRVSLS